MSTQYLTSVEESRVPPYNAAEMAQGLYAALARELAPLLIELDARIDKRLVRTHIKKGYYTPPHGPIFVPGLRLYGSDPGRA